MTITIRPYRPEDRDRVLEIFRHFNRSLAKPGDEARFEAYIEHSIAAEMGRIDEFYQARDGAGFWVAVIDGGVVGNAGIEPADESEGPGAAELRRMYVDAAYRRQGIGNRLLDHIEDFCVKAGYARLVLSTSELQGAAKATYDARGYIQVREDIAHERSHKTVGGGVRRFHYEKSLTSNG